MTAIEALSADGPAGIPTTAGELASREYLELVHGGPKEFPCEGAGFSAWTIDLVTTGTAPAVTGSGLAHYTKLWVPRAVTVTTMAININVAGSGNTGYCGMAIYSNGATTATLLRSTTTNPTTFTGGTGLRTCTLTSSLLMNPGYYWFGWLYIGTTVPRMNAAGRVANQPLHNANGRRVGYMAGAVTAFPATFTISSLTTYGYNAFMGAY